MASEVAEHKYQLNVKMTCGGCSGAVTRVLTKAQQEGSVSSFDVDLGTQLVNVTGPIEEAVLVEKIRRTGKEIISVTSLDDSSVAEAAAV
ncbi:copper chaperone taha [Suillus plorans]|uniref:Copper chaperone taha n=1 Tax=Suillus plorans TaxID=116603 RepID=A0A9P7DVD7_9AGAM|nr:copper chaperone taha [Suillus plorans]KAG1803819.1 copper chaperone taha [Suillus plorans]